jgi:hypothetical protein
MQRDPSKVVDVSRETQVNWDHEIAEGNLTPLTGLVRDTSNPECLHVQGRPLSEKQAESRVVPASVMQHVAQTGRYPLASGKRSFGPPPGGWPGFNKEEPKS